MEFPTLGVQCDDPLCKALDFLPIMCRCRRIFCREHFNVHVSLCEKGNNVDGTQKISNLYPCSYPDCHTRTLVPIDVHANRHYCIEHRHTASPGLTSDERKAAVEQMLLPVHQFQSQKQIVNEKIDQAISKAKRDPKKAQLANQIQLLRVKNKALGPKSIPVDDRIYFTVSCEKSPTNCAVFVSKLWSTGRVIDSIAETCQLRNNNNRSDLPQLILCKSDGCSPISNDLSIELHSLLSAGVICNGDLIVLKYTN